MRLGIGTSLKQFMRNTSLTIQKLSEFFYQEKHSHIMNLYTSFLSGLHIFKLRESASNETILNRTDFCYSGFILNLQTVSNLVLF